MENVEYFNALLSLESITENFHLNQFEALCELAETTFQDIRYLTDRTSPRNYGPYSLIR